MSRIDGTIVFTDLDGTLLDHDTYSFEPAKPVIEKLKDEGVPIIPVTSKTKAELLNLRALIGIDTPFVVENGAAIYVPKGYFAFNDDALLDAGTYWCKHFAPNRCEIIDLLENAPVELKKQMRCFYEMTAEDLVQLTGLSLEQAVLAAQRDFSEPFQWLGSSPQLQALKEYAEALGYELVKGGRFYHLTNGYDKGQALYWLKQQYMRANPSQSQFAVALGDSSNDIDMLEAADQAILIKNPNAPKIELAEDIPVIRSAESGPRGWAAALNNFLDLDLSLR